MSYNHIFKFYKVALGLCAYITLNIQPQTILNRSIEAKGIIINSNTHPSEYHSCCFCTHQNITAVAFVIWDCRESQLPLWTWLGKHCAKQPGQPFSHSYLVKWKPMLACSS